MCQMLNELKVARVIGEFPDGAAYTVAFPDGRYGELRTPLGEKLSLKDEGIAMEQFAQRIWRSISTQATSQSVREERS